MDNNKKHCDQNKFKKILVFYKEVLNKLLQSGTRPGFYPGLFRQMAYYLFIHLFITSRSSPPPPSVFKHAIVLPFLGVIYSISHSHAPSFFGHFYCLFGFFGFVMTKRLRTNSLDVDDCGDDFGDLYRHVANSPSVTPIDNDPPSGDYPCVEEDNADEDYDETGVGEVPEPVPSELFPDETLIQRTRPELDVPASARASFGANTTDFGGSATALVLVPPAPLSLFPQPPTTPVLDRITAALQDLAETVSHVDMEQASEELYARWIAYPKAQNGRLIETAHLLYGVTRTLTSVISEDTLDSLHQEMSLPALRLYRRYLGGSEYLNTGDPDSLVSNRFMRVLEMIYNCKAMIQMDQSSKQCLDPSVQIVGSVDIEKWAFKFIDKTDNTPYQNLLLYLLECCYKANYRKYGTYLYAQTISNYQGEQYRTHAWEERKQQA